MNLLQKGKLVSPVENRLGEGLDGPLHLLVVLVLVAAEMNAFHSRAIDALATVKVPRLAQTVEAEETLTNLVVGVVPGGEGPVNSEVVATNR